MLISANTQCTGLVTYGMLVTLVTFIYRFVCCEMSTLLNHIFQCQQGEVSEIRCVSISGMLLPGDIVRFFPDCCVFFLLEFCISREQIQKYSKHSVITRT